jgi:hypothetical protein
MTTPIEYRRIRLSDTVTVLILKKTDLDSREKKIKDQVEEALTGSERTIIHGNTFIQRNGYNELVKGVKFNKNEEKLFIIAEKPILRRYDTTSEQGGIMYYL